MIKHSSLVSLNKYAFLDKISSELNLPISSSSENLVFLSPQDKLLFPNNYKFYISPKENLNNLFNQWDKLDYGFLLQKSNNLSELLISSIFKWSLSNNNSFPDFFKKEQNYNLSSTQDKTNIINQIEDFLISQNFNKRVIQSILYVSDEMIMNALFDAPINSNYEHLFQNIPRDSKIQLNKPINIKLSYENNIFAISVKDNYGSLKIDSLISKIKQTSKNLEFKAPLNSTGAGLGLAQSIQKGANLIFKLSENNFTEVLAFFPNTETYKQLQKSDQLFIIQKL